MATEVVMPQMGESIAEGTITKWLVKVGDTVERDQPLFEISTDKVDAEIPSPAAGTLLEIRIKEGETVPVNQVVATIGEAGEAAGADKAAPPATAEATAAEPKRPTSLPRRPTSGAGRGGRRDRRPPESTRGGRAASRRRASPPPPRPRAGAGQAEAKATRTPRRARPPSKTACASSRARWCATSPPRKGSTSRRSRAPAPTAG